MRKFFPLLLVIIIFTSCQNELPEKGTMEYIAEIKAWHKKRIENLKMENGWLNLVGLMWLNEGENKFGSDRSNNLVFPEGKAESFMGSLFLEDSTVTIEINKNVKVFLKEGGQVEKMILKHDQQPGTTILCGGF